jgi:hypothetical protein
MTRQNWGETKHGYIQSVTETSGAHLGSRLNICRDPSGGGDILLEQLVDLSVFPLRLGPCFLFRGGRYFQFLGIARHDCVDIRDRCARVKDRHPVGLEMKSQLLATASQLEQLAPQRIFPSLRLPLFNCDTLIAVFGYKLEGSLRVQRGRTHLRIGNSEQGRCLRSNCECRATSLN